MPATSTCTTSGLDRRSSKGVPFSSTPSTAVTGGTLASRSSSGARRTGVGCSRGISTWIAPFCRYTRVDATPNDSAISSDSCDTLLTLVPNPVVTWKRIKRGVTVPPHTRPATLCEANTASIRSACRSNRRRMRVSPGSLSSSGAAPAYLSFVQQLMGVCPCSTFGLLEISISEQVFVVKSCEFSNLQPPCPRDTQCDDGTGVRRSV